MGNGGMFIAALLCGGYACLDYKFLLPYVMDDGDFRGGCIGWALAIPLFLSMIAAGFLAVAGCLMAIFS